MQLTFPLFLGISSLYSVSEDTVGRLLTCAVWKVAFLKVRNGWLYDERVSGESEFMFVGGANLFGCAK